MDTTFKLDTALNLDIAINLLTTYEFLTQNKCQDLTNLLYNIVQLKISSFDFSKIWNLRNLKKNKLKTTTTPLFFAISPKPDIS